MYDDLRNTSSSSLFDFEDEFEEEEPTFEDEAEETPAAQSKGFEYNPYLLGMTPAQRFILAVMFFVTSCILSTMFLIATGRIFLPF